MFGTCVQKGQGPEITDIAFAIISGRLSWLYQNYDQQQRSLTSAPAPQGMPLRVDGGDV